MGDASQSIFKTEVTTLHTPTGTHYVTKYSITNYGKVYISELNKLCTKDSICFAIVYIKKKTNGHVDYYRRFDNADFMDYQHPMYICYAGSKLIEYAKTKGISLVPIPAMMKSEIDDFQQYIKSGFSTSINFTRKISLLFVFLGPFLIAILLQIFGINPITAFLSLPIKLVQFIFKILGI